MTDHTPRLDSLSPLQRAVFALREATAQLDALKHAQREPIAIVGMGCRFPGGADPGAFWDLLARGGDAIREVPRDRWDVDAYYDPDPGAPGKMYSRSAGFIDRVDGFDPIFFGISPREAVSIDPQQRLLLEVCWEALEHAGQSPDQLRGSRTGVFVGIMTNDYFQKQMAMNDPSRITPHFGTGGGNCFAAGRISHFLGLQGPSMPIDTACSSSLVTIHLACRSLRLRECDMALAGGVNLILAPGTSVCMAKLRAISEDGRCKAFDASADGYGRGEGCGMVVLKRLSDAIAHRDSILGVIRGSAVNHDGPSGGLTLPNGHAQQAVAREALGQSGLRADDIDFVEVHGTGTALGDPIEVHALAAVLCQQRSRPLVMGTVKTNIGHLEAAAGVAGLIKVLLSLEHSAIPPHLHLRQRNAYIAWDEWPLEVPESLRNWPAGSKPRSAAINTYGLSGTNAHVIVQEAPVQTVEPRSECPVRVLTLSAREPAALSALAKRFADHLASNEEDLADICFTSNVGRTHFDYRWACVADSREQCIRSLQEFVEQGASRLSRIPSGPPPKFTFCFPEEFDLQRMEFLCKADSFCADVVREAAGAVERALGRPLAELLEDEQTRTSSHRRVFTFLAQWILGKQLIACGVPPSAFFAVGGGRWAAHYLQSETPLEDAITKVFAGAWDGLEDRPQNHGCRFGVVLGPLMPGQSAEEWWALDGADVQPAWETVLAQCFVAGAAIDWDECHRHFAGRRVALPTYPFQRRRYWLDDETGSPEGLDAGAHSSASAQAGNLLLRIEWTLDEFPSAGEVCDRALDSGKDAGAQTSQTAPAVERSLSGDWLILSDRGGVGSALEERMRRTGANCQSIGLDSVGPAVEDVQRTIDDFVTPWLRDRPSPQGIVYLWPLDLIEVTGSALPSAEALSCAGPLRLLQCAARPRQMPVALYLATCGAHRLINDTSAARIAHAPLWGLARVAMQEFPAQPITCIDLDPEAGAFRNAEELLEELQHSGTGNQVTRRRGRRYVARLVETAREEGGPFALETASHESFDQLRRVPLVRRAPAANEVEIRVEASGLNFRDVLNVLGQYPGDAGPLGGECAGQIVAAGADVTDLTPGQTVIAIGPACFASHVITRCELVAAKPERLDAQQAATLPIAFLTAGLSLDWAQLAGGEHVLIHAATGGVGMAALQIARQRGAVIHATAGNREKRDLLRRMGIPHVYDSRSLEFADQVLRDTGGRGVDVVLNSLAGGFIAAGVKALAPDGRFVEIGKSSILTADQFARLRPGGRYCVFALDQLVREDLIAAGRALRKIVQQVEDGELEPLPHRVFPISDATAAFRTMAQARHIGKIVLSQSSRAVYDRPATYIITGGLGGLGLLLARRLVQWGARSLLLVGRTAPGEAALAVVEELSATGAAVVPYQADVASAEDVARLLAHAAATMPVVRGIFHLAGVLDDGPLAQQTWPRFASVLAPKLRGAWNLHHQTADLPLDHFVLFSSAASILGSPGQGTYAAANAFLDALAHFRRASGLPALSINWGPWAQAGMAARVPQNARRWSQQGILGIEPEAGLEILADLLGGEHTQCAVLQVNKAKLRRALAASNVPFFKSLLHSNESTHEDHEPEIRRVLHQSPVNQRQARVQEVVQRAAMRVLGLAADQPLDTRRPFRELGLDSLLAVDLIHSLSRAWGKPLSATLLFRHSDVESLARYFVDEFVPAVKPVKPAVKPIGIAAPGTVGASDDFIAIVGMGCRFPGGANDPDSFWRMLRTATDAIVEVPADRWPVDSFYDPDPDAPGKMYTRWGGFVNDVDRFDPAFFGIAPGEALSMDPQQRLFLEVAWEALENAGIPADRLAGTETGVFLGISTGDYSTLTLGGNDPAVVDAFFGTGSAACIAAGRLSYLLGLKGPNLALDTGCSSSLVALHLACQSLRSGECRVAIAAGVNLILSPIATIYFCKLRAMARDGRCKTFSAEADGFVRGEGCGVVVLKRLADAVADGDRIEAIVRGTAMNHDGRSNGLTAPNAAAQAEVIERCLQAAGLTPQDISFIETHGSGTSLGDPIECSAIAEVFGKQPDTQQRPLLALGAVKSNIGHLEAAAGVAGLIKLVLALQHGEIPANLHCQERNPRIDWQQVPLLVPTAHQEWPGTDGPRRGGVSSFSFSGTNIHAILEEPPATAPSIIKTDRPRHILTLSAQSEPALLELVERYIRFLEQQPEASLADICFSANTGRSVFAHRLAVVAESRQSMIETLGSTVGAVYDRPLDSGKDARSQTAPTAKSGRHGIVGAGAEPKVAFFFPGGDEFPAGLGAELFETQPTFREAIEQCDRLLQSSYGFSILPGFRDESQRPPSHVALFCLETALAHLWRAWGVEPTWVAGNGVGVFAASVVSGERTLAEALRLVVDRQKSVDPPEPWLAWKEEGCGQVVCLGPYSRSWSADIEFISCLDEAGGDWDCLLEALALVYVRGVKIDWRAFDRDYSRLRLRLPNYPFQRQSYWLDHRAPKETSAAAAAVPSIEKTPFVRELEVISPARRLARINGWLKEHAASLLGRMPESLPDGSVGFFEMGLDSLKAIELGMRLRGDLGDRIALPSTLTFDYPNLDALGGFIANSFAPNISEGEARRLTIDHDEAIAVIGIGCKFPGEADGPERFWDMLRDGRDAVRPVPGDRWPIAHWYDPDPGVPGKMYCARGAFLPRVDLFDAWFFGISPREANYLDPQQRLLLEVTWEALEHAALAPQRLVGSRTGVFVGISGNEYMHRIGISDNAGSAYIGVGNSPSAAAGRLSYVLGLQGPSLVVDTACSSSLVAVHEACQSLRAGESDHAIAAGVNVLLSPWAQVNLCQAKMLAPDGQCKTFSTAADGYGRGEGCGVVILKRLRDAIRDKDRVWAVLRASAINQDGRSSGLTVPNGPAQQSLIRDVLARASVAPSDVDYVEAHGTGTSLGDPIELHALAAVYGAGRAADAPLRVGSVKTNIGHLEAAAGIAGLIKVILALNHDLIPSHLHCDQPTDRVPWDRLPMVINREPFSWARNGRPRRAAVSSFGFVGTNAHVLVEDPPAEEPAAPAIAARHYLIALSAKDETALGEMAKRLSEHLKLHSELDPAGVSRTLTLGRSHFEHRLALVVSSIDEAGSLLSRRGWFTKESFTAEALSRALEMLDHLDVPDSGGQPLEELLAAAYVTGENIDWARYWSARPGRCVPLPTYAFQRQRYWIEESDPKERDRTTANSAAPSGTLPGRRISSALEAIQFESRWSSSQPRFLADHCLYGKIVVPGAAYLSMWLAAGKHLGSGAAVQTLKEVSFPQSLILADDQERTVQLIAQPQGTGQYDCRICSLDSTSENWITHATAQWCSENAMAPAFSDFPTNPPSGTTRVESFYALTEAGGLRLGPSFRWIDDLWRTSGEAWAAFRIATSDERSECKRDSAQPSTDDLETPAHPGLIDACFQVLGSAMPAEKIESNAFVPVGLDRLTLYGPVSGHKLWCHARLRDSETDPDSSRAVIGAVKKMEPTFEREDGVVFRLEGKRKTTPSSSASVASQHFLDDAATPPCGDARREMTLTQTQAQFFHSSTDRPYSFVGDVCIYDESGHVRLQLEGVRLQSAPRQALLYTATLPRHATHELVWRGSTAPPASDRLLEHWVILADKRGFGAQLAERLRASGAECHTIPALPDARERLDALRSVFMLYRGDKVGIVSLWALDAGSPAAPLEAVTSGILDLLQLQSHLSSIERFWLVTEGGQIVLPAEEAIASVQAAAWGLGRVLAQEHPAWRCTMVDLHERSECKRDSAQPSIDDRSECKRDSAQPSIDDRSECKRHAKRKRDSAQPQENAQPSIETTQDGVTHLLSELQCDDQENQVAWRGGQRYVARLVSLPLSSPRIFAADEPYSLSLQVRGVSDSLALTPCARPSPGAGEIEIGVAAAALNFRDVLNVLDLYPGDPGPLGLECAGAVTAIGEGVTDFSIGDEVVALAPACFSRYALTRQELVARKPAHLDFADAAGIPVAFLTASYALERLARLSAGESVLIHLGTGGVGLAAIQLAQRLKATIFATAGSGEKRAFLKRLGILHVCDSRSPAFATAIRELTGGQGIDVVLNSLSGDLLNASIQCLKPNGRFIEIGKIGIKSRAEFHALLPQARYEVFALDHLVSSQSQAVGRVLGELMKHFEDGVLVPCPHRTFPLAQAPAAMRLMSRAGHIGKIILSNVQTASPPSITAEGTYLITGASGGLGPEVAQWLADRGAKRLVLTSRRSPDESAQAAIGRLAGRGVKVSVQQADVARREDVARLIQECGPGLRGVFHLAGVVDDALLSQMDAERWQRVWLPKVMGAWHLHEETRSVPLDFFVLFSSAAAILGAPGQGNYAAANAVMDLLAHERRQEGLPAQTINWGPWSNAGMAARLGSKGAERFTRAGIGMLGPSQGLALLDAIVRSNHVQVVAMPLDIDKLQSLALSQSVPPLFAELAGSSLAGAAGQEWIAQLHNASPSEQRSMVLARLRAQVAAVLGLEAGRAIDMDTPLREIGMDSLMAVELTRRISAEAGRNLPATLLFDYTNLNALAGFVLSQFVPSGEETEGAAAASHAAQASEPDLPFSEPDLSFIEALPSDQVHAMLDEELSLIDDVLRRSEL